MREKILFNEDWIFHEGEIEEGLPKDKGPIYHQAKTEHKIWGPASMYFHDKSDDYTSKKDHNCLKWETVTLPHDYIIKQEPKEENNNTLGYFKYENAWYRKHFTLPKADDGKRITLLFEGVATEAEVFLNGCPQKHNFCGYTPFEVDITDVVRFGEDNVLAVHVGAQKHEGWWYSGAGIYRHVWLSKTNPVATDLYGVFVAPKRLENKTTWDINFETTVRNDDYTPASVQVKSYVYDAGGVLVVAAQGETEIAVCDKATAKYKTTIENPHLWDIEDPYQYSVKTEIILNGEVVDVTETKTGFRTYYATPDDGFYLNDRYVKIKGVCAHQDCGLLGKAVADNVNRYKIEMLKEMGANGFRCSHYPQNEAIMDALDDLGFIVMAETRWYSSSDEAREQLAMHIRRDRNRPSVFFWSIGNEEAYHITEQGRKIGKHLKAEILKHDTTRLIMTAADKDPLEVTVADELDLVGINYNLPRYDAAHEKYPTMPIFASECCATSSTRGWYFDDCPDRGYMCAFDKDTVPLWFMGREHTWKFLMERKYVLGGYQWDAFEHRGETVWPRLCSQAGAIDLFLQKKDAFYQNQSHWSDKPMIHMLPHWNLAGMVEEGEEVTVWAYTNCPQAELFLNGKSYGKVDIEPYGHAEWKVEYLPGKVEVIAYKDGKAVATDTQETSGRAEKLMLRLENRIGGANGRDVAIVTCYAVDGEGRVVPDACPTVEFNTNKLGRIVGTGSDVCDHTPVPSKIRKMRAGAISVAVQVGKTAGTLQLFAVSENLTPARLNIELEEI